MPLSVCPECGARMPANRLAKHIKKTHPARPTPRETRAPTAAAAWPVTPTPSPDPAPSTPAPGGPDWPLLVVTVLSVPFGWCAGAKMSGKFWRETQLGMDEPEVAVWHRPDAGELATMSLTVGACAFAVTFLVCYLPYLRHPTYAGRPVTEGERQGVISAGVLGAVAGFCGLILGTALSVVLSLAGGSLSPAGAGFVGGVLAPVSVAVGFRVFPVVVGALYRYLRGFTVEGVRESYERRDAARTGDEP